MASWNANTVPKCKPRECSDEVLVTVEHKGYQGKIYRRVLKAVYFSDHNATVEDMGWNMYNGVPDEWEYDEEQDSWWIPQGWYETADNFVDYSYASIDDKVTAWMKLPKAYEGRLKGFNDYEQSYSQSAT